MRNKMKHTLLILLIINEFIACKPKKQGDNKLESSDNVGQCSSKISLVQVDTEIHQEDLVLEKIEVYLDEDTVNYFDIRFISSKDDSRADYAEYIVCGSEKCLCSDELKQPTQVCGKENEKQIERFSQSYLQDENIRIPADFSGLVSVAGRLCKEIQGKKSCGELVMGKGNTELSPLTTREDESIQFLLNDKAKEMVSLVDELSFELDKHSKTDERINSLSFNLNQNKPSVKALLVHHDGVLTYSTVGQAYEDSYQQNCDQQFGLVDGESTAPREFSRKNAFKKINLLQVLSTSQRVKYLAEFSRIESYLASLSAEKIISLSTLDSDDGVVKIYNDLVGETIIKQNPDFDEKKLMFSGNVIVGYQDQYFQGRYNPIKGTMVLSQGFPPLGSQSFEINDAELANFQANGKYNLDTFPVTTTSDLKKNVVVSGSGISGLISAINLIDDGYDVTLFEKYKEYTRNQVFVIDEKSIDKLINIIGKPNYEKLRNAGVITNTNADKRLIATNDLQRVLFAALEERRKIYSSTERKIKVEFGSTLAFSRIGPSNPEVIPVVVRNGIVRQLGQNPDFIVGADSSKSEVARAAGIRHDNVSNGFHAFTAVFELEDGAREFALKSQFGEKDPNRHWIEGEIRFNMDPKTGGLYATKNQVYFYGELTKDEIDDYNKQKNPEAKRNWILKNQILPNVNSNSTFNTDNFRQYFNTKKFSASGFPIDVTRAQTTVGEIKTPNGSIPVAIPGDSGATTNFLTGTGANRAVESADLLAEHLKKSGFGTDSWDVKKFNSGFGEADAKTIDKMHRTVGLVEQGIRDKHKNFNDRVNNPVKKSGFSVPEFKPTTSNIRTKTTRVRKKFTGGGFNPHTIKAILLTKTDTTGLPEPIESILTKIVETKTTYDCIFYSIKNGYSLDVCSIK